MKKKSIRKILSIVCMAVMLTSLLPRTAFAAEKIQKGLPKITIGTGTAKASATTVVGFGGYQWYVIGYNGSGISSASGTMTLLSVGTLGQSIFGKDNRYKNSVDCTLYNTINLLSNNFQSKEKTVMMARNLGISGMSDQYLWPLSIAEIHFVSRDVLSLAFRSSWWSRDASPTPAPGVANEVACVNYTGLFYNINTESDEEADIRTGLTVKLQSVLFTSAAVGGKSTAAGPNLSEVQSTDGAIKFTLQDASQTLSLSTTIVRGFHGDTVSIGYSGVTTGANQYISAIITDESGKITSYGKLKAVSNVSDADGTVQVGLPLDYNSQTDTLKLFSEQINSDNKSDFASAPVTVTVESPYCITATAGRGGSISPAGITDVIPGGNQGYTLTPKDGYMVDQVFVDGAIIDNDNLISSDGDIKTYEFSNLSANHNILAIFAYKDGDTNLGGVYLGGVYTGLADNPKTGDSSDIIPVGLLGLSSLLAVFLLKRKNKKI